MREADQSILARRSEVISGVLAVVAGLVAIGVQLFAPLVTVHVAGPDGNYIRYASYWEVTGGFIDTPLGLAALGLCLLCLVAIGYGAYAHDVRHAARGRLLLWSGAALFALEMVLSITVFGHWPANDWLFPHDAGSALSVTQLGASFPRLRCCVVMTPGHRHVCKHSSFPHVSHQAPAPYDLHVVGVA